MATAPVDVISALASARETLARSSTAEKVADIIRQEIIDGAFAPGRRLKEDELGKALGVSRNTLREAFRLLLHERLVIAQFNRGVFVRQLARDDIVDLYRLRRLVECAAVRCAAHATAEALQSMHEIVAEGERAADGGRGTAVGTANMRFHQAIVATAGSVRLDEYMCQVTAELRLAFHVMSDPQTFHEPYLRRNRDLLALIEAGDGVGAERFLAAYLDDAEAQLLERIGKS